MPRRLTPLINNVIYHVFNKGIDYHKTFLGLREYKRAIKAINFYRFNSLPTKLSYFLERSKDDKEKILELLSKNKKELVKVLSYCLMPNHFHFLLKQTLNNGISKFMSNFQNSYSRYYNIKHKRKGSLFLGQFKAVRIETDEQLIHVSRYIHLNPYSSFIVKTFKELENYPWSSLPFYIKKIENSFVVSKLILDLFENKTDYYNFVFDQADYQRELEKIKHLTLES